MPARLAYYALRTAMPAWPLLPHRDCACRALLHAPAAPHTHTHTYAARPTRLYSCLLVCPRNCTFPTMTLGPCSSWLCHANVALQNTDDITTPGCLLPPTPHTTTLGLPTTTHSYTPLPCAVNVPLPRHTPGRLAKLPMPWTVILRCSFPMTF